MDINTVGKEVPQKRGFSRETCPVRQDLPEVGLGVRNVTKEVPKHEDFPVDRRGLKEKPVRFIQDHRTLLDPCVRREDGSWHRKKWVFDGRDPFE